MYRIFASVIAQRKKELEHEAASTLSEATVTREDLGRATWTLLHSVATYYPATPSRQQQRDAKSFVESLSRLYPCEVCAKHFQDIIKENPPRVGSGAEFQDWMCDVHNTVNRSLKKPTFNCSFLQSRWGAVDCGPNGSCKIDYRKTT